MLLRSKPVEKVIRRGRGVLFVTNEVQKRLIQLLICYDRGMRYLEVKAGRSIWSELYPTKPRPMFSSWKNVAALNDDTEVGDVVEAANFGYSHYMVVVEDKYGVNGLKIVELTLQENSDGSKSGVIQERPFFDAAGQRQCRIANRLGEVCVPGLKPDIVDEARSAIS